MLFKKGQIFGQVNNFDDNSIDRKHKQALPSGTLGRMDFKFHVTMVTWGNRNLIKKMSLLILGGQWLEKIKKSTKVVVGEMCN